MAKNYVLSREERETVIIMNEADNNCIVHSMSNPVRRKLKKLANAHPSSCNVERENQYETKVTVPKSYIHLYAPRNMRSDAELTEV